LSADHKQIMPTHSPHDMPEEHFQTFDDEGEPLALVPRSRVHALGLWHRSVHVFLFDAADRLWIQQRADDKDLFPGRWDFSVGEHLRPNESYRDGALRGLAEELSVPPLELEPLGEVRAYVLDDPARGIADHELQLAFAARWSGTPVADGEEVQALRAIDAATLGDWIARAPKDFTPWFLHELACRPGLGAFAGLGSANHRT
jgi:isopentenyldiphosphate isomerase